MGFLSKAISLKAANDNLRVGEGYERLMRSLDGLLSALDRQAEVVSDFRGNCASLEASVDRCVEGLKHYQTRLDAIDTGGLKRASEALSRTADGWLEGMETPAE